MTNVWIFSDPHYGHKGIVRGESHWEDKRECRNFDTIDEHNDILVQNINKCAKKHDIIYCLGDWSFGGRDNIIEFRKRINCKNIYLIMGNHDRIIRNNGILKNGNTIINAQNLFRGCYEILEKKIGKERFIMSHYSFRTWHKANHGSIMLYGHSHGSLPEYEILTEKQIEKYVSTEFRHFKYEGLAKTMDVGIDTHPEFRPYHIDEIREIIKLRNNLKIDHHV